RVRIGVELLQPRSFRRVNLPVSLAQERVDQQATTHADPTLNTPDRQLNSSALQRFAPCEHMLVYAVDERAVEIENERRTCGMLVHYYIALNHRSSQPGYQRNTFPVRLPMKISPACVTEIQCPGLSIAPRV